MKKRMKLAVATVCCAFGGVVSLEAATISVAADETHILTAEENVATNDFALAAGATLQLPAGAGDFALLTPLKLTGAATLKTGDATSLVLQGGIWATAAAYTLTVDGLSTIAVGKPIDTPKDPWYFADQAYARFDLQSVAFTADGTKKIVLQDNVSFVTRPEDTADFSVEIAKDARILALNNGQAMLNRFSKLWNATTKTFTVSGFTLVHARSTAVNDSANSGTIISVATDGAYYQMQRMIPSDDRPWNIQTFTCSSGDFNEQIRLEGVGAVAGIRLYAVDPSSYAPQVSGTGDFSIVRDAGANVTSGQMTCNLNAVKKGWFNFTGSFITDAKIDVQLSDQAVFSVGTLALGSGSRILGGELAVGTLAADSTTTLVGARSLTVSDSGAGAAICVTSGDPSINLAALDADKLPTVTVTDGLKPDIRTKSGASMAVEPSWSTSADWTSNVLLWFDADDDATITRYDGGITYTNGYPLVSGWMCKNNLQINGYYYAMRSLRGLNFDGTPKPTDEHRETCPYLVSGGLNGRNYLSYGGGYWNIITEDWGKAGGDPTKKIRNEGRRMNLYRNETNAVHAATSTSINPSYAILVFGSQQGGGAAVLGRSTTDAKTNACSLARGGHAIADPLVKELPFADFEARVNGVAVDPTQKNVLNGGWQIISLKLDGKVPVSALGWLQDYNDAGGQNYAEVIFFKDAVSDEQRDKCEHYLAQKWGLLDDYKISRLPVFASDGNAAFTLADDATLAGGYHGTLTVPEGKVLMLTDYNPIPSEAKAVPQENLVAWFDPSFEGSIISKVQWNNTFPETEIGHLRERDLTSVKDDADSYAFAGYYDGSNDRCPLKDTATRGYGTAQPWMKFADVEDPSTLKGNGGNALRTVKKASSATSRSNTAIDMLPASREAYLVLDTSAGGGNVLGANATGIGWTANPPGAREYCGTNYTSAIWKNATGYLSGATARLDNEIVDAATQGYNGRPEVYSFTTADETTTFQPSVLAYYSAIDSFGGARQGEVIGEVIFYSTPLSDEARAKLTAHLAYKWFGKVLTGYNDVSRAKVLGAGRILLANGGAGVPDLSEFAGTVETTRATQTFTCTADGVADALVVTSGKLDFSATSAITVSTTADAFTPGTYTLASATELDLSTDVTLAAAAAKIPSGYRARFRKTASALTLSIEEKKGLVLLVR